MKKIFIYTGLTILVLLSLILTALYSFNLGKSQEYERLNNKYVFNCLESSNQYLSYEEKKECYAKMYKNKLWQMQSLFSISLAIEHSDGNFLSGIMDKEYIKEIYPVFLEKCFKNLDDMCINLKLNTYHKMRQLDIIGFLKDLNYTLTNKPQYYIGSDRLFMEILKLNQNICTDIEYKDLIIKLKNNNSIKHADFGINNIMHGANGTNYGLCNKYIYNLPD